MAINEYTKGKSVKLSNNFTTVEFDCKGGSCCGKTLIDEQLVQYLQQIREHFGKPITITSGYRCATHNANVGGATGSRHTKGQAADIVVSGVKPAEVAAYAESIGVLGIGLYETNSDGYFVHVDTRPSKSFWYGQRQEGRTTFGGTSTTTSTTGSSEALQGEAVVAYLPILSKGANNKYVKVLQSMLGLAVDGIFGANTQSKVIAFQKEKGLTADGVVGSMTWGALFGTD